MFLDIYELSRMDQIINGKEDFKSEQEWCDTKRFFKDCKGADCIEKGLIEFKHRLAGGGMQKMVPNKIQDDINVYIAYTLKVNQVIANILSANKQCCPMQIDMVIIGQDQ